MNLFKRNHKQSERAVVIGLDGTPFSLASQLVEEGRMPNLAALLEKGTMVPMESVVPTVSSVAWASIVTGCNPGKHNIFGFIDRVPLTYEMFIPSSKNLLARTWIELLSSMGKRVFSMGVPTTYPPKAVNGILISGFLAPNLEKATYPLQVARELEAMGYTIDIDAWQAREDKEKFLDEIFETLECRLQVMFRYLAQERWDLFVAHIMDTDRLHHFLWGEIEDKNSVFLPWFYRFYDRIDQALGELASRLDEDVLLMILSDHGFCRLKKEVHLNYWLRQAGYLKFASRSPKQLRDLAPDTRCYSLLPGRFYICVEGRERNGCVSPGGDYEALRKEISEGLLSMRDPDTGDRVIRQVLMKEDIYAGDAFEVAPDFLAVPEEGFDLKGGFEKEILMESSPVTGTHTVDDAMFYMNRTVSEGGGMQVVDVMPTLMEGLGVEIPDDVDGRSRMSRV